MSPIEQYLEVAQQGQSFALRRYPDIQDKYAEMQNYSLKLVGLF